LHLRMPLSFMQFRRVKRGHVCVTNDISYGRSPLLPVGTVHSVQTLKVLVADPAQTQALVRLTHAAGGLWCARSSPLHHGFCHSRRRTGLEWGGLVPLTMNSATNHEPATNHELCH
jgi:hypothetical protein